MNYYFWLGDIAEEQRCECGWPEKECRPYGDMGEELVSECGFMVSMGWQKMVA